MTYGPIALTRRHVLGDLYSRCDAIVNVPVYLNNIEGEMIGYADESLGHYADAFRFHLSEEFCKKLAAGHFTYSFDYEYVEDAEKAGSKRRIKLNHILLTARKGYAKPEPKVRAAAAQAAAAAAAVADDAATVEPA